MHWVAAGLRWQHDAVGCPSCGGRITFAEDAGLGWSCRLRLRPARRPSATLVGPPTARHRADVGRREAGAGARLRCPGRFNRANALMAAVAAEASGVDALRGAGRHGGGAARWPGRFTGARLRRRAGAADAGQEPGRAGTSCCDLVARLGRARGRQHQRPGGRRRRPVWLWDVPYERLAGRTVVATGDRFRDLSVRLHYGGVAHRRCTRSRLALSGAADAGRRRRRHAVVDVIGNYTAFHDLLGAPA